MVKRTSLSLMVFIAIAAILMLFFNFNNNNVSGSFTATGGGRYYYGQQIVQFSPEEACSYFGCQVGNPIHLTAGTFGTYQVACSCIENGVESIKWVPLVQVINFNN